ncbi:hypothetical protein MYX65_06125 [Acidobacteria bacterium AH-259-L09]|nr:hypothetical protein [Acidobacteria bacterium AH-259-L09]
MKKAWMMIWAAIVIHVVAFYLMIQGVEPISTDFFIFAWWTYIVFLSGVNHLRGRNSLLLDNPGEFVWVFLYSIPVWLFFEIYNFSLNNWHYIGIPVETYLRLPGYMMSFGTILPGIFETETLLKNFGVLTEVRGRSIRVTPALLIRFVVIGFLMMLFVPFRPDFFFPLVWLGCIFLLDPLIYWGDQRQFSFLARAERGDYAIIVRLLVTGMICGLLWEFWNYWASAKWVYTVPYLGFLKIFEMPMLGFFGFPPFALECYVLYRAFLMFRERFIYGRKFIPVVTVLLLIICCILAFMGIDRWTVETYKVTVF